MKKYLTVFTAFMLTACLGMETEIDIKENGSGTLAMTYRISDELFSPGTLPGNENLPSVPIGKEDFERTFSRIPGMGMVSYSEKEDGGDKLFLIKARFENLDSLTSFLDANGRQATLERKDGKTILSVSFDLDKNYVDTDLAPILPLIFENYSFDFKISLPRNCEVSYMDGAGAELSAMPYGETNLASKSVAFHSPMADLFSGGSGTMVISW
ncbi:MAG: hypothetical protein LBD86_01940 [Spirochaetaceae bacterium]|nr:hypothetical protein [Spirochaetaceae bacterium]